MKVNYRPVRISFLIIITSICLLLASTVAQAAGSLPQGKWKTEQVTIEKNTDGNLQTVVYNTFENVQSHIPCLQGLEVNAQTIVLHYSAGWQETAKYTLDGDQLIIHITTGTQTYWYSIEGESLVLIATYNYVNNDLIAKQTENITEKWIITFKKQR